MPSLAATPHRKQPCNGCRTRKKRCDTARPACSNCRKWGLSCDYTNRTHAAEKIFGGFGAVAEGLGRISWPVEQSTGTVVANDFSFQSTAPCASNPWQVGQSSAQADPILPDIFSGLDSNPQLDVSCEAPLVVPEPAGDVPVPTEADFAALLDCRAEPPDLSRSHDSDTQSSGVGTVADTATASPWPKSDLPPQSLLLELVDIYFAHHQIFLPFLHKRQYVQKVERFHSESPGRRKSALLYAVIAIAAVSHPDADVRSRRPGWFAKAKRLIADTERRYPSLEEIQTSLCICILAWTTGDYPLCWLSIGIAWRQAVTLGLNRIDGERYSVLHEAGVPKCPLEKEEQRRTIWTLFLMDRGMAFPCGWPHAIDDRQFMVNLPVDEDVFQSADENTQVLDSTVPFSRNLRKLITSVPTEGTTTVFQSILKAYVLLGRVTEHVHSLEATSDPAEHFSEFQQLDTELSRFKLSLPRATSSFRSTSVLDTTHVFWLNVMVGILVVLLHHRPESDACKSGQSSSSSTDTPTSGPQSVDGFEYCVTTAMHLSGLIKDATKISIDVLINPHVCSSLYACCRTLALHHVEAPSEAVRSDVDMYLLLFDRIADVYPTLGAKFRNATKYTLAQDAGTAHKIKADGARGMLTKCGDWSGPDPQATLQNLTATYMR